MVQDSSAQLFQRKSSSAGELPPRAIFVEIKTHQRKQEYYKQKGFTEKARQLQIDIDSVSQRMVMDFTDNFDYCPVYYFIDVDRGKITAGDWDGVLLDSNMKTTVAAKLLPTDNFQIVYFGFPIPQQAVGNNDDRNGAEVLVRNNRQRLVVLDKKGYPVKRPLPNGSNNENGGPPKRGVKAYKYKSPLLDIYYVPYAKNFNQKLYSYYGAIPNSE
ncbi:MAG: hypothetical protein EOP56_11805 [Sphingobacteriales bacterium]|nr:MAG: hypothetical protein EOP56_11805 [Sphingobacteriales bacterium]